MPSYLSLINWTDQGVRTASQMPQRVEQAKEAAKAAGGRIIFVYLLMGEYDLAVLSEMPDDATAAKSLLRLAGAGNIRSKTMKAFTEEEAKAIVSDLGGQPA